MSGVNYPKVLSDGSLEFDINGPVPKNIPCFVRDEIYPNRFHPIFKDCPHRGTKEVKLNNCKTCTRTRDIWWCSYYNKEVFPLECSKCELNDQKT